MKTPLIALCTLLALGSSSVVRAQTAPPPVAMPSEVPPPPPSSALPPGQWVNTSQYGWVYLPYDQAYTYIAADSGVAQTYVYSVATGWSWVYAPWVLGVGPAPVWGPRGRVYFSWYAHPWFRVGSPHYRPGVRVVVGHHAVARRPERGRGRAHR
jgi:hypothetical protein